MRSGSSSDVFVLECSFVYTSNNYLLVFTLQFNVLSAFQSDEWTANPDDYLDTIFSLNSDFLSELDELQNMQMDTTPPQWTSPQTLDRTSPLSSVTTESECDFMSTGGSMNLSNEPIMANEQHYVSSSASDSGLSSDNVET